MPQALIGDVAPRLRNPSTEEFITRVNDARLGKTLRQLDLVLVSVFYIGDYPLDLKIYKAQHYFFHEFMSSFRGRLAVRPTSRLPLRGVAFVQMAPT
jgi:hypothetical protein